MDDKMGAVIDTPLETPMEKDGKYIQRVLDVDAQNRHQRDAELAQTNEGEFGTKRVLVGTALLSGLRRRTPGWCR